MHDAKHLQKKNQNKIVSKWRLVWHLSKLETFIVKLQRYIICVITPSFKSAKSRFMKYLCNFTVKVSNFDKCQTRRHFETIKKEKNFVSGPHHASNRHLNHVITKKVIIWPVVFWHVWKSALKFASLFKLLHKRAKVITHRPTTLRKKIQEIPRS